MSETTTNKQTDATLGEPTQAAGAADNITTRLRPIFTEEGLARIQGSRVLVIGLGGVGSSCVEALARACVGELSNFLLGATFAFIAGIVYKKHKNRSGALWGSVAGAAAMALISLPLNYFIVYPAYVVLYGLPLEAIVGMYQEILGTVAQIPTGNALFNCLLVFNVPFTLCKGLLDVALCFLIYKPLSPLLHK